MKKLLCVLLSIALLCLCGCAASQSLRPLGNSETEDNGADNKLSNPFTDEFFADVVEIGELLVGKVSGEQMAPVIAYLKGLELKPSDTYLSNVTEDGEELTGGRFIEFKMSDGTTVTFMHNHMTLTNTDGSCSYVLVEGNLNTGLQEAFNQAMNGGEG